MSSIGTLYYQNLTTLAYRIVENINLMRDKYFLFQNMAAKTHKGHQVFHVMNYKKFDGQKFVKKEMEKLLKMIKNIENIN